LKRPEQETEVMLFLCGSLCTVRKIISGLWCMGTAIVVVIWQTKVCWCHWLESDLVAFDCWYCRPCLSVLQH